jgi:uncharacterized protein YndB with AHSA1/START domain
MHYTERGIEIDAPVERVFDLLADFENIPRWLETVTEVRQVASGHSLWRADGVEWETETTAFEPDHRIAWRSVRGDIRTEGEIVLEETRRGTTWLRVVLGYDEDDPRSYDQVRDAFGNHPGRELETGLQRLARMAASRRRQQPRREQPRISAYGDDREPSRVRFESPMRDDRRDELARRNRDYEERRRDERRLAEDRRTYERRHGGVDRGYYYHPEVGVRPDYEDEAEPDEPRWRYAMTPREREEMRRQGGYDDDNRRDLFDKSREVLKRGVDRLLDNPPSSRWNR